MYVTYYYQKLNLLLSEVDSKAIILAETAVNLHHINYNQTVEVNL